MAKRFIDTNYFDDPFILSLKKDEKLLYVYLWTQCDHAGIYELNERLGNFHLDIKDFTERLNKFSEQFPEKIAQLDKTHFILLNFCKRQYPGGVNTNVRQISGAKAILDTWNIEIINNQTFTLRVNNCFKELERLNKDYGNVNGNIKEVVYSNFYDEQIKISTNEFYLPFVKFLFSDNITGQPLKKVLSMSGQISSKEFEILIGKFDSKLIKDKILALENDNKKKYNSFYLTLNNWCKNGYIKQK